MSRSFRHSDQFRDTRESFADRRARFEARQSARRDRAREFEALGFDDSEGLAALPLHGETRREQARRAFGH